MAFGECNRFGSSERPNQIQIADGANLDSFSRLRASNPTGIFDCQFTYDLQPLVFEQITNGSGATIAHDATNREAVMTFASTPTGGKSYVQSYEYHRYQPGNIRVNGRYTVLVTGIGATSAVRCALKWKEVR